MSLYLKCYPRQIAVVKKFSVRFSNGKSYFQNSTDQVKVLARLTEKERLHSIFKALVLNIVNGGESAAVN